LPNALMPLQATAGLAAPHPLRRHRLRWRVLGALLGCVLSTSGCATLPAPVHESLLLPVRPLQIQGSSGPLPAARSAEIVRQLQRQADEAGPPANRVQAPATAGRTDSTGSDILQRHLAVEEAINARSPLVLGNRLRLLQDGPATYAAMFEAMQAARDHIHLQTYIFADDAVGQQFADVLLQRQAAGVQVSLIYDSVGSLKTPAAFFDRLREAGVQVLEFNPVNPASVRTDEWRLNNRDHRKLLLVDGRTAFVGGININESYASGSSAVLSGRGDALEQGWRDTHLQVDGPVVAEFQKLFLDTWARQKGPPMVKRDFFPALKPVGQHIVRAIGSNAEDTESLIYSTLLSAIDHAETHVLLTMAYFVPDPRLLQSLMAAAQRGVDVRLVLPSQTDSWAVFHAGRSHYTRLLRAGVKLFERRGSVLHAKTATVDGVWSTIGSTNLDWRSFLHNDELNAVVLGHEFAQQLEAMFADDQRQSDAIDLRRWQRRSPLLRLKEWTARLAEYWL
jgi:cardiolipin synthase A/B